MNRLQKKCFIVSTGIHLLLVVILIVGPAFLSSRDQADNVPTMDFVPATTIDGLASGGGEKMATPTPPAPPPPPQPPQTAPQPPQPQPKPPEQAKVSQPDPPKIEHSSPDALEPAKETKHKIDISKTLVTRDDKDRKAQAAAAQAKEAADAKRRLDTFNRSLASMKAGLSPSTKITMPGDGTGGVSYGNFLAAVKKVYTDAWDVPAGVSDDAAATISVTIARDGTVISARIVQSSGNGEVDKSVQSVLDRVKFVAPLPENAKEDQRTVEIVFDVKSKLIG